jgi:hypothetical protein
MHVAAARSFFANLGPRLIAGLADDYRDVRRRSGDVSSLEVALLSYCFAGGAR